MLVAESTTVEDEVAVPGLSLDTAGEPLLEVADDCGASGEKGSMSAINPTRSGGDQGGRCGWSDTMESSLSEERNRAVEAGRRTASRLKQTKVAASTDCAPGDAVRVRACGLRCAHTVRESGS